MKASAIDDQVLAIVGLHWRKVAFVVARVAKNTDAQSEQYEAIAERVRALVVSGHLIAQGDLSDWRHSEVRQSNGADDV